MRGNPAQQIIFSYLDGAAALTAMAVAPKQIVLTLVDGSTDFAVGDKFTIAVTANPTAVAAAVADDNNTGNGIVTVGTPIGDLPAETITLTCTVEGATGTFKAEGSKTGRFMVPLASSASKTTIEAAHDDLTVGSAWTHIYQQIEVEDEILAALEFTDAGAVPVDKRDDITVGSGSITCSDELEDSNLLLIWRDVTAG